MNMEIHRKKNDIMGSTHTFIFTHAPIVCALKDSLIGPKDYTHVSPNDYWFVRWVMNPDPNVQRPNIEAVFCGHTHMPTFDVIHGVYDVNEPNDKAINWTSSGNNRNYPFSADLLSLQTGKTTG